MFKHLLLGLALAGASHAVVAHEIWIQRDAAGPVRIYFGEPAEPASGKPDEELSRIKQPRVFAANRQAAEGPLTANGDHFVSALVTAGDAWLFDDAVFVPWKNKSGGLENVAYYARAGRGLAESRLDFELVPVAVGSDQFTLLFRGKPLASTRVTVINPDRWQKYFTTNEAGVVSLPLRDKGRYLLSASNKETVNREIDGKTLVAINHVTTLTFVVP